MMRTSSKKQSMILVKQSLRSGALFSSMMLTRILETLLHQKLDIHIFAPVD